MSPYLSPPCTTTAPYNRKMLRSLFYQLSISYVSLSILEPFRPLSHSQVMSILDLIPEWSAHDPSTVQSPTTTSHPPSPQASRQGSLTIAPASPKPDTTLSCHIPAGFGDIEDENPSEDMALGLPRVDGGFHAWTFLACAFVLEAAMWGMSQNHFIQSDSLLTKP